METIINNPWEVETLDAYLYYCCPECEHKCKTKPLFVDHAYSCHPEAKETLKYQEVKEEIVVKSDVTIKEETIEPEITLQTFNESYYFDKEEDWYETDEAPEPKKKKKKKLPKIKNEGMYIHRCQNSIVM